MSEPSNINHVTTCAKNTHQHPGLVDVDKKKTCRTAAEVAAECKLKVDAKNEKEHTKRAGIKHVAKYEKGQADQDAAEATPCAMPMPKSKSIACSKKKARADTPRSDSDGGVVPSDVEMADHDSAEVTPRAMPMLKSKSITRSKKKAHADTPRSDSDGGAVPLDVEMSDLTSGPEEGEPDSEAPSSPPRKKAKVGLKKAGKAKASKAKPVRDAIRDVKVSEPNRMVWDRKLTHSRMTLSRSQTWRFLIQRLRNLTRNHYP